jgi:Domain of unknown function (DUF222)
MFDTDASTQVVPAFVGVDNAGVVDVITDAARQQNAMCGRELAAIGELYARRAPADDVDRGNWAIDGHENVVAEVAAALGISRGRARGRLHYAIALRERLPRVAEVFGRGLIDFRMVAAVVSRTELVEDPVLIAKLDVAIARHSPKWMRLSGPRLFERIDMWVMRFDPAGKRVPRERTENRYVEIAPTDAGLAGVWAQLHATDGVALDQKLDALAETVCAADPRTKQQRRADALAALTAGLTAMRCQCGSTDCSAAQRRPATDVVIHVLAEQATISGDSQSPGYLQTFGPLDSTTLRDMATTAKIKPLVMPSTGPERGYRPSPSLADFVRCRDLTCRFPGCDKPAEVCDLDHTVPFPMGPTHASNLKLLCRYHHLLKTFYTRCGGGWADRQLPDGTVEWTSPSGHTYTTTPGGSIFFPVLARSTGELKIAQVVEPPRLTKGLMMPRRKRTRAEDRRYRITSERRINEQRLAEERLAQQHRKCAAGYDPPPF